MTDPSNVPDPDEVSAFDASKPYRLSPRVGLRPEPFGALAYHFETRRLVFLKANALVDVVEALGDHPSADAAIEAAIQPSAPAQRRAYITALASLLDSGIVVERPADEVAA